jgi:1,2-phenylacetyl-CoA epoxidase catalytic subunit
MKIPIDTIGFVIEGENKGFYIKITEDLTNTGGYLLLYSKNFGDKNAEGYDEWFLDYNDMINYIIEYHTIKWIDN